MPAEIDLSDRQNKPSLEEIMRQQYSNWDTMQETERGQVIVEWLREILQTPEAAMLREMLVSSPSESKHDTEGVYTPYYSHATNSVSKEDLLYARPDLTDLIEAANEYDLIDEVADKVGDALQEMYWDSVRLFKGEYFKDKTDQDAVEDLGDLSDIG